MTPLRIGLAVALTALFAVAGCGGDDDESGGDNGGRPSTSKTPDRGKTGKPVTVVIKDRKFSPRRVTVARGGSIYWVNKDAKENHTATKKRGPGQAPASPNIGLGGGTYTDFFRARGRIEYICTNHPRMRGVIVVE